MKMLEACGGKEILRHRPKAQKMMGNGDYDYEPSEYEQSATEEGEEGEEGKECTS